MDLVDLENIIQLLLGLFKVAVKLKLTKLKISHTKRTYAEAAYVKSDIIVFFFKKKG